MHVTRTLIVAIIAVAMSTGATGCTEKAPTTEETWAAMDAVRDSVPQPLGYRLTNEYRYGGDGCTWGPGCEGDPVSTVSYQGAFAVPVPDCDQLTKSLLGVLGAELRVVVSDEYFCVLAADVDGIEVAVESSYRRQFNVAVARTADEALDFKLDPYALCDYAPDPVLDPHCF